MAAADDQPRLRRVTGPSATAGGARRFFHLLYLIAVTDFKKVYFNTALGYIWSLLRPLMLFAVLLFVFTQVFRIGSEVNNYPVLLLFNIVFFGFFSESTLASVTSVMNQETVVRKTQFPRLVIPLSMVLTGLFNLGLNMIVVLIFMLAFGVDPMWTWLLFPVLVLAMLVLTVAVAMLLSVYYVRFRDVLIIWTVTTTMLFYASPVLYPIEFMPEKFYDLAFINPLTPIIVQARAWVIDADAAGAVAAAGGWLHLVPALVIYVGVCILAVRVFNREAPRIAEEL
ncbi:MAG: ABC transporter permease [Thermoleophilia bacterium]|nr:ABC transporter permease [Thermoleophilia bacterium]